MGAVGVVAFLMAVQPFIQMLWGRPKIQVAFIKTQLAGVWSLECRIYNRPITNKVGKWLRMRRDTADDIWASFSVKEKGSGTIVVPDAFPSLLRRGVPGEFSRHVSLPATAASHVACPILIPMEGSGVQIIEDMDDKRFTSVTQGEYIIVFVVVDAGVSHRHERSFVVRSDGNFDWVPTRS